MTLLDGWTEGEHTGPIDGRDVTHPTYRRGTGPGVVLVSELPGINELVVRFAQEVIDAGFTVVMPHLFGTVPSSSSAVAAIRPLAQVCISREFTTLARGRTSPVATWLRSLARSLHEELGGPGVGALGMCLTGGFALAMMVDDAVVAPVLAQPSLPVAIGRARAADLGLSPADVQVVRQRAAAGCEVLGVRYQGDRATGTRFDTLTELIGDRFVTIEFPGRKHATLTLHRQQEAVDRVLAFFRDKLAQP